MGGFQFRQHAGKVIAGIVVVAGAVGTLVGATEYFVNYKYHDVSLKQLDTARELKLAGVAETVQQMQRDMAVQRAEDAVMFYLKMEMEVRDSLNRHPEDRMLKNKLDAIIKKREAAERKLEGMRH
jgi:hypothetical protein